MAVSWTWAVDAGVHSLHLAWCCRVSVDPTVAKADLIARVAFNFDRDSACDLMATAILGAAPLQCR